MPSTPHDEYVQRRAVSQEIDYRLDRWSAAFGNGRVALVFGAILLLVVSWSRGTPQRILWLAGLVFLIVVSWIAQGAVENRRRRAQLRIALYDRWLARLAGQWRAFPSKGLRFKDPAHPYAADLDVIGDGSLFQLLDTTVTAQGEETLAGWILRPGARAEILGRQQAIQALSSDVDGREALALAGADDDIARIDERPLREWAEGPVLVPISVGKLWAARVLPFVTTGTYWLVHLSWIPWWPLVPLALLHAWLFRDVRHRIGRLGALAEHAERMLSRLVPLLGAAQSISARSPGIDALRERLRGAREAISDLKRRVTFFQSRNNLIVAFLSPLLLWDLHAAHTLQVWQSRTGSKLREWFLAIGELEALAAGATYTYENESDAWPAIVESEVAFRAEALGHPLLPIERCVRNDLLLNGAGTGMLITGSNMSGKSTMLRAVGLNAVLALAGLPVRATSLSLSIVQVATVMRVSDSLQEGASFFLAEVQRLKRVVDLAGGERTLLFLLDEILQGTNTRERSLGAKGVIAHLLDAGAFGLVSTHDLSLVQLGETFGARLAYAHFTDQVEGDTMTFDYRLKPGVVQTSNALRLMRAVGLNVEIPAESAEDASALKA